MPDTVTPEIAEDRPHAERSASQLGHLALCAGYLPARGTKRTHWVTAQGLRGHAALEDAEGLDELQTQSEEDMVALCEQYVAPIRARSQVELSEIRVNTIEGRWGYIDKLFFSGTHIDLVDWKFVRKAEPKDAEINLQGKDYLVGVLDDPQFVNAETVTVHFVAPRFNSVTTATFNRSDLPRIRLEILAVLALAKATDRGRASQIRFTPEFDTCRYCGRLATCPAVTTIAKKVGEAYTGVRLPLVPADVHSSNAKDLTHLGHLKMLADILRPWVDSVDAHTAQTAKYDGLIAEGYELAYRKGQRKVINPDALLATAAHFGVTKEDIVSSAKVSIPALEKIVMAKAPKGFKAIKRTEFINALRDADAFERLEDTPFLQKIQPTNDVPQLTA